MAVLMFRSIACTVDAYTPRRSAIRPQALTLTYHTYLTYINDPTKRPNSIRPVHDVAAHRRGVLHNAARHHNHILGRIGQLLDDQIDHLAEGGILVLEELADAEEERGGLVGGELLAGEEEEGDFGEEDAAFAGRDGGGVEDAGYTPFDQRVGENVV